MVFEQLLIYDSCLRDNQNDTFKPSNSTDSKYNVTSRSCGQIINPRATADLSRKAILLRGLAITEDFEFVDQSAIVNTLG